MALILCTTLTANCQESDTDRDYRFTVSRICEENGKAYEKEGEIVIAYICYWHGSKYGTMPSSECMASLFLLTQKHLGLVTNRYMLKELEEKIKKNEKLLPRLSK